GGVDLFARKRHRHPVDMSRVEQATRVLFETEHSRADVGVVGADTFEYRKTVVQRMGEYMHVRFTPRHECAIKPDEAVAVCHRRGFYSRHLGILRYSQYEVSLPLYAARCACKHLRTGFVHFHSSIVAAPMTTPHERTASRQEFRSGFLAGVRAVAPVMIATGTWGLVTGMAMVKSG